MTAGSRGLRWWSGVAIVLMAAASSSPAEPARQPASSAAPMGQVKIEGGGIEGLVLVKRIGQTDTFDAANPLTFEKPGRSVSLPPGQYLARVVLRGGYSSRSYAWADDGRIGKVTADAQWLTVSPDKPCTLKAGVPLKLVPFVYRQGRVVRLMSDLVDAQGRQYHRSEPPRPLPQFTVYQGDREVASSESMSLEYG